MAPRDDESRGVAFFQAFAAAIPLSRPGSAHARLRVPGAASGVNPRLPRRATRNGGRYALGAKRVPPLPMLAQARRREPQ